MRRIALAMLLACLSFGLSLSASAQRVEGTRAAASGPFEAEVPVRSQSAADRDNGFARALVEVLGNLSGSRNLTALPGMGQELRNAKSYVRSYDYRQDEGVSSATGAPTFQTTLVVRFDEAKVTRLATETGVPVWPNPRPKPVLWLAIDDGSGPRLVGLPQAAAARPVLDRAKQRGYGLGLPAGTAAEQAAAAAIWRGDTAAIARLSSRYVPPMQLLGKLYRSGANWKADWVFVDNGRVMNRWSNSHADARTAMSGGADGTADALVRRYARRTGPGPGNPGTYRFTFIDIDGADDYLKLTAALQRMSIVRGFTPVTADGRTLVMDLNLGTGLAGFARVVDKGVLAPAARPAAPAATDADKGGDAPATDKPASSGGAVYRVL